MSIKYTALEGKTFVVDLPSRLGSTNYGWCLTQMPREIILIGTENIPTASRDPRDASIIQRFHFGVISSENLEVTINLALTCLSDCKQVVDTYKVNVLIVPANSEEYKSYSENETQTIPPYGLVYNGDCLNNDAALVKYGFPCRVWDTINPNYLTLEYGFPPATDYGYPCGVRDAAANSTMVKYGYPCGIQDSAAATTMQLYGFPPATDYGYPCGVRDAAANYTMVKYGYPCGVQNAATDPYLPKVAYGYPRCM